MDKFKLIMKILAYIVSAVLAVPVIVVLAICAAIIYGILWLECEIICDIWDERLVNAWNEFVKLFGEMMDNIKEWFTFEMELV